MNNTDDLGVTADLTFSQAATGAAMDPLTWDGTQVFWSQYIGKAVVDGTITFANNPAPRS